MKVEDRLGAIEKELAEIKAALSNARSPRVVKLRGKLKGLRVDEDEVMSAKRSLFKNASN